MKTCVQNSAAPEHGQATRRRTRADAPDLDRRNTAESGHGQPTRAREDRPRRHSLSPHHAAPGPARPPPRRRLTRRSGRRRPTSDRARHERRFVAREVEHGSGHLLGLADAARSEPTRPSSPAPPGSRPCRVHHRRLDHAGVHDVDADAARSRARPRPCASAPSARPCWRCTTPTRRSRSGASAEEMFTIEPPPHRRSAGTAARMPRNGPV